MLDFIMKLFGHENINKIKIPEGYRMPRIDKMKCKASFYAATGEFQDKIIINNNITYKICQWIGSKYVKVLKIDVEPEIYKHSYRGYRLKNREKI